MEDAYDAVRKETTHLSIVEMDIPFLQDRDVSDYVVMLGAFNCNHHDRHRCPSEIMFYCLLVVLYDGLQLATWPRICRDSVMFEVSSRASANEAYFIERYHCGFYRILREKWLKLYVKIHGWCKNMTRFVLCV